MLILSGEIMYMKYIYPHLPAVFTGAFFRIGGNGLANCMFIVARAVVLSKHFECELLEPTWFNFSPGAYMRRQADKRHYLGLFKTKGFLSKMRKWWILHWKKNDLKIVSGLGGYFEDILSYHSEVSNYFASVINPNQLLKVCAFDFRKTVAIHIRLGDYDSKRRIPISWYVSCIEIANRLANGQASFLLFSDGKDSELSELLILPNIKRVFMGSAVADICAMSKCNFLIGSDSTFSGWAAYLGQTPCIFARKHYGAVLCDSSREAVTFFPKDHVIWQTFERIFNE